MSELGACGGGEATVSEPGVTETPRRWKFDPEGDSRQTTETEKLSLDLCRLSLDVDSSQADTLSSQTDTLNSPTDTRNSPSDTWGSLAARHRPDSQVKVSAALPATEPGLESADTSAKVYERAPLRKRTSRDIRSLQRIVKTPYKDAARFSRTDPFVQEAMDALKKAIDLSEGENIRAVYDLALMHRALDEFDEALKLLDTMPAGRA